jgi:hypothetical protein
MSERIWVLVVEMCLVLTAVRAYHAQSRNLEIYWIEVKGGAATLIVSPLRQSLTVRLRSVRISMSAAAADIALPSRTTAAVTATARNVKPLRASGRLRLVAENFCPPRHLHVVFTLPRHLAPLVLQNNTALYDLLFRASAETVLEVAIPDTSVQRLVFSTCVHLEFKLHPHVHCVVPAGGLSLDHSRYLLENGEMCGLPPDHDRTEALKRAVEKRRVEHHEEQKKRERYIKTITLVIWFSIVTGPLVCWICSWRRSFSLRPAPLRCSNVLMWPRHCGGWRRQEVRLNSRHTAYKRSSNRIRRCND